ncbi:MAG TPA: S9 family peptidase [Blastocatellia bacterium]|nr:S9 family peptidase [Blastocatellia bacterium]
MSSIKKVVFAVSFVLLLTLTASGQIAASLDLETDTAKRNLAIDDLFQIKRVADPQISPDGKWVAYTVGSTNLKDEKSENQIWMIPTAGGEAIPMTMKGSSASSPRWSPDGKYLAFIAARNEGKTQVWLLNRLGGEAQQLTEVKQGVSGFEWSPDSSKILLTIQDPRPEDMESPNKDGGAAPKSKTQPPWVIDRLQFKQDVIGYLDHRRNHFFVFDMATKKVTQITSGDFDDSQAEWSPDSKSIAFTSNRGDNADATYNTDIWVVDVNNTDQGKSLRRVTTNPGRDRSPAWSPDGKWIAYVTTTDVKAIDYAAVYLAVIPAEGGTPRILTQKLDRNANAPKFSTDGKTVYFLLEENGEHHLARIPVAGGDVTRPIGGPVAVSGYSLAKDGTIAARISEATVPGEIYVSENGDLRRLTSTNDAFMAQIQLGDVEKVKFKSKDGTDVEGFIYKPTNFVAGTKYPTLLRIHGGPVSQFDRSFNFESQLFAANGYVVVNVNPRGSSGYGQAFSAAIFADWGNKDYEDVMAGVDYAIAKGYADPNRLGVGGWSYGGILTDYVITKTDRFKGAITGASEVLYVANYGHDHYQRLWEQEMGLPWENRQLWEKLSPFNYVQKIVTPTLIMGGEKDWNVPVNNGELLYQSLKRLGRTTQLIVYPGESHGIAKPSYQKDRFERYLAWYAKFVKGAQATTAAK